MSKHIYEEMGGLYPSEELELFEKYVRAAEIPMRSNPLAQEASPGQVYKSVSALAGEYWRNGNMNWDGSWQEYVDTVWNSLVPGYYDDSINDDDRGSIEDWPSSPFDTQTIEQIKQDLRAINLLGYSGACRLTSQNETDIMNALLPSSSIDKAFVRLIDRTIEWTRSRDEISKNP